MEAFGEACRQTLVLYEKAPHVDTASPALRTGAAPAPAAGAQPAPEQTSQMDLVQLVERAMDVLEKDGHIFQATHAATLTAVAGRETIERDFLETVFAKYGALDALDAASRAKLARELHRALRRFANSARRAHLAEWQQRVGRVGKELR